MAHHNTVFVQLLRFLPRHEFEAEARQHQRGQGLRVMSRWAQFVALGLAQLTGRQSLRDIVSNLSTQGRKLYHLGVGTTVSRSSLARVNAEQPYTLYETLFGRLLSRCQQCAPRHGFRFKNKLYAVDATTIDLCWRRPRVSGSTRPFQGGQEARLPRVPRPGSAPAPGRFQPAAWSWRTARILTSSGSISCRPGRDLP